LEWPANFPQARCGPPAVVGKQSSNIAAVRALSEVTQRWLSAHGLEAYTVIRETEGYARTQRLTIPDWADKPTASEQDAGEACRFALTALLKDDDQEIRAWTNEALAKAQQTQAQVLDPITLAVGGLVLGGLILAARIKHVGPDGADFYEGIPPELAKVLKAGANFFSGLAGRVG
jgi:hypothetical protein